MSRTSTIEEQQLPPSSWSKARNFISFRGGKKRQSQLGGARNGATQANGHGNGPDPEDERVDDDAQDQDGPGPVPAAAAAAAQALPTGAAATASPTSAVQSPVAVDAAQRRRGSHASVLSAPPGEGERDPEPANDDDDADADVTVDKASSADEEEEPTSGVIEFLHKGAPYFWLSNHFLIPIYYDGIQFASAEHLFQSLKFPHHPDIAKAVRKAETASDAVRIARKHAADVRRGWRQEAINVVAMREVLLLKFTQHSALRSRLLQTGDAELINASPTDVFWGSGKAIGATRPGVGRNELGKALMRTRDVLMTSAGLGWGSASKTV